MSAPKKTHAEGRRAVREALTGLLSGTITYAYADGVRDELAERYGLADRAAGRLSMEVERVQRRVEAVVPGAPPLDSLSTDELAEVCVWACAVERAADYPRGAPEPGPAPECLRRLLPEGHYLKAWRLRREVG